MNRDQQKAIFAKINQPKSQLGKLAYNLLQKQPPEVKNNISRIHISNKALPTNAIAGLDTDTGEIRIYKGRRFIPSFQEPYLKHEFAHVYFNKKLHDNDPKIKEYVGKALDIKPPTTNMIYYYNKLKTAKNHKKPELRGTYADELHAETAEYLALKKYGNTYNLINKKEMKKALEAYKKLHS